MIYYEIMGRASDVVDIIKLHQIPHTRLMYDYWGYDHNNTVIAWVIEEEHVPFAKLCGLQLKLLNIKEFQIISNNFLFKDG